jgi:hypothetical protein
MSLLLPVSSKNEGNLEFAASKTSEISQKEARRTGKVYADRSFRRLKKHRGGSPPYESPQ